MTAKTFLEESLEDNYDVRECGAIEVDSIPGYYVVYETRHEAYAEYAFNVTGADEPTVFNICLQRYKEVPYDKNFYTRTINELLKSIARVDNS